MAGQLGHILGFMSLPSVSLGVIPFSASGRPMWTLETFTVFDDARVHVELLSAQVTVTAPGEVTLYLRAFDKLKDLAVYGQEARAPITAAINAQVLTRKLSQVPLREYWFSCGLQIGCYYPLLRIEADREPSGSG